MLNSLRILRCDPCGPSVDIDARMKRRCDQSRWEISAFRQAVRTNADAFIRAGDRHIHLRFAIMTTARERLERSPIDQLSGSSIGRIINRFYDKRGIRWCASDIEDKCTGEALIRGDWSSVISCEYCAVTHAHKNLLRSRRQLDGEHRHAILKFSVTQTRHMGYELGYVRDTWMLFYLTNFPRRCFALQMVLFCILAEFFSIFVNKNFVALYITIYCSNLI